MKIFHSNIATYLLVIFLTSTIYSCKENSSDPVSSNDTINAGNDPNFKIEANADSQYKGFNRKVDVFGIPVFAVSDVEDSKLLHAANVMAQYLDNNEDGKVDNQAVLDAMLINNAFLFLWASESDFDKVSMPANAEGQDLGNNETHPNFVKNGKTGSFDASLEEVLHIITHAGYANSYPNIFGENSGTSLTNALDIARGGKYTSIPTKYPSNAWFTYDDATCTYNCQATEYLYWAMTSILGAQENRLNEIQHEWKLNTKEKVQNSDKAIYSLLTDPQYKFPTVLPDGTYKH